MSWPDHVIDTLTGCPPESLRWAAVGYRVGVLDRCDSQAQNVLRSVGEAGADVASGARAFLAKTTPWEQIVQRQVVDHQPCPAACGRCSRCVHAEAYARRGHRDYLGAEREAELARGGT